MNEPGMRRRILKRAATVSAFALLLSGCATQKPLYYWGHYEQLVYEMYEKPGKADPATQLATLLADEQKAAASGQPLAPGIRVHMAFVYWRLGQTDAAVERLQQEKAAYPESTVLVDGMLARISAGPADVEAEQDRQAAPQEDAAPQEEPAP